MEIATPYGLARVEADDVDRPAFWLVLTHGSGGGVETPDLSAIGEAARELGGAVARVTQPFRVAGRRAPGSAARQDEAWLTVVEGLRRRYPEVPLIQGGRSNGARVACRTASAVGAARVIALAFPLHPPGRPERSRAGELASAGVPVLVVGGDRDPFGVPDPAAGVDVHIIPGARHDLAKDLVAVGSAAAEWLRRWGAGGVGARTDPS